MAPDAPAEPVANIELEQALLGAILLNNDAYRFVDFLQPQHFFEPLHRQRRFKSEVQQCSIDGMAE